MAAARPLTLPPGRLSLTVREAGPSHRLHPQYEQAFVIAKWPAQGGDLKLDLLYEFQPKIKPWTKPHPYGQREAEQRTRVEWGTGRSTPMEPVAFGVPTDDRSRDQWREAIQVVIGMWESEKFSWESENLSFPERMQTPKPFQDPHPPSSRPRRRKRAR